MANLMICMTLLTPLTSGQSCPPSRGGHATIPPPRGGHALLIQEPIPHLKVWMCIHPKEGAWNDTGDPYWGGLQMDRPFMEAYGSDMIHKYGGWADEWSPRDQMVVAERAYKTRGFGPWPNTRIGCG